MGNKSAFLIKLALILGMPISLWVENIKFSPCKRYQIHRKWTITAFFSYKRCIKVLYQFFYCLYGNKHKFRTLETVPDRVFIATSCYDMSDALISICTQWIVLTSAPFILLNSLWLHYFFLKYMNSFSNMKNIN